MSDWSQPICRSCYGKRMPDREPVALVEKYRSWERCCDCGETTLDGIFVRVDPKTVKHPTIDLEDQEN